MYLVEKPSLTYQQESRITSLRICLMQCYEDIPDEHGDIAIALLNSAMELPTENHRNSRIQALRNCLMLCFESLPASRTRDRITAALSRDLHYGPFYVVYDNRNQLQGEYEGLSQIKDVYGRKSLYLISDYPGDFPPIVICEFGINGPKLFAFRKDDDERNQREFLFHGVV